MQKLEGSGGGCSGRRIEGRREKVGRGFGKVGERKGNCMLWDLVAIAWDRGKRILIILTVKHG